jgi:hypothetical protein
MRSDRRYVGAADTSGSACDNQPIRVGAAGSGGTERPSARPRE